MHCCFECQRTRSAGRGPLEEGGEETLPDEESGGGEEEAGILNNFPEDRRTAETALLFLQLIMRRLKRAGRGRAAVVVPHGTLFGDGISARIKADLLEKFNLHTVVRLREGVFAPYTDIPANLIFFDTTGPTKDIWYSLPTGIPVSVGSICTSRGTGTAPGRLRKTWAARFW